MADALVSAVMKTVVGMLGSAALQEVSLVWGLNDEIDRLESVFGAIQIGLHDAELKQRKSEPIQNWLRKLKDAAYEAEDILDTIATEGLRRRADSERGKLHQFKSFLFMRNPLSFRLKMVEQVKNITKKLDDIAEERHKFHLSEGVAENRFGVTLESRITSSLVNESEIYGRGEEKEVIMEKILAGGGSEDDLCVHVIQGMGGLGKTTLAQMVYNDQRMERHFELRIWVCVSDDFNVEAIVRAILESVEGGSCNISGLDPLVRRLQEKLMGRRYLLVLDDIWNENHSLWDELKQILRCGSEGSVVIVTTRIEKVASMMATTAIHHINYLSEDDSWSLFKQRAFSNGVGEENLIAIGKAIVKKCGGVPLAIKALGSLMILKSHEREWRAIEESEMWDLSDEQNGILPALRLSYDNLLPQMRQCFAYCCIFPKDDEMEEDRLIQLWMANGYIPSDGQTHDMYLTGQLIFKELVWRSFLQDVQINNRGNMSCKMHDLMHDLASSVMKHEACLREDDKKVQIPKTLRHFSFVSGSSWRVPDDQSMLKLSLRSIIIHEGNSTASRVPDDQSMLKHSSPSIIIHAGNSTASRRDGFRPLLSKQKYLRAYDGYNFFIHKLPNVICKLVHLRYLVMVCYGMKSLSGSLTNLHNLQTLKLIKSDRLIELPKGLKLMKNLWFLEMESFYSLICTPPGLGNLSCLRSLSIFIVGKDGPHQIYQLKDLELGGKLSVKGLDNVTSLQDARSANLMTKSNLTCLSLSWKREGIKRKSAEHFEEVLQGLQPHQNIEEISIANYHGSRFPDWMSTFAFRKLKQITLEDCPGCEHLPPFGKLPSLTSLSLYQMDFVKCLDGECYGDGETSFPALKSLKISSMRNLERWTMVDSTKSCPCLERLQIWSCPKLAGIPKLPTLKILETVDSSTAILNSITSTDLNVLGSAEVDVLPRGLLQNHKALEKLEIYSSLVQTVSNVLDNLSALKDLIFTNCDNLEFLPGDFKCLSSLNYLHIAWCDGLGSFPLSLLEGLCSLTSLRIEGCKKLKHLSGPLQQSPTALHYLALDGLPELEYLPENVRLLTSLGDLRIYNCKKLKSLPDGFKDLYSLNELFISECPQLEKRCEYPKGEDWPKISHIPSITINGNVIQRLD